MTAYSTISVERGEVETVEFEVEVQFECHAACRGHRDSMGVPEEPDESASADFDGAVIVAIDGRPVKDGADIDLTPSEIDRARENL